MLGSLGGAFIGNFRCLIPSGVAQDPTA